MMTYFRLCYYCAIFIPRLINSQNFNYDVDDGYILTRPGSINAITEDNFNLYFATDKGVFTFDKSIEDFKFDYTFSMQLEFPQIRHMVFMHIHMAEVAI